MSRLIRVGEWGFPPSATAIFVHGLDGDAYQTWQRKSPDSFWPRWLGEDVEGLSIFTLSYAAPASNWLGTAMPLQDRAANIRECILAEPALRDGPIALICHSLGGLLIKQLLLDLHSQRNRSPNAAQLLDRITKIIFIATPHTGSHKADVLDRIRFLAWPTLITSSLVANDPTLRAINVGYRGFAQERKETLRHLVFYETQSTATGLIVDQASSDPGLPGDPPIPIDANHISIVKPIDRSALLYLRVKSFISESRRVTTHQEKFSSYPLPVLSHEQPWNTLPKLLRIATIATVGTIAFKGVQAIINPPPSFTPEIRRLTDGQETLVAQNDKLIDLLQREKGVPRAALVTQLIRLGARPDISESEIPTFLQKFAGDYLAIQSQLNQSGNDHQQVAAARRHASELLAAGRDEEAQEVLRQKRSQMRDQDKERAREQAGLVADEAKIDLLKLDYRNASAKFLEAANLVSFDPPSSFIYLRQGTDALSELGQRFGDANALSELVNIMQHATDTYVRNSWPSEWSAAKNDMGAALWLLARKSGSTADLEKAREALKDALLERDRQTKPMEWAATQVNLGGLLLDLAERDGSSARYFEAIDALRGALKEWPQNTVGSSYAQNNLGVALMTLGSRDNNAALLEEAITEFGTLIKRSSPERQPSALVNLGRCLTLVGTRDKSDKGTDDLRRAVTLLDLANKVIKKSEQPILWADAQNNRGLALRQLGLRTGDVALLERAVMAFNSATELWTRSQAPLQWSDAQQNLGLVLRDIGQSRDDVSWFNLSEDAFRNALLERTQRNSVRWLYSTWELGQTVRMIADKTRDVKKAQDAVELLTRAELASSIAPPSNRDSIKQSLDLAKQLVSDLARPP
ncbi:hypothetical protein [Bradyrhizobium iriomotense]|uniref:hypothetical protein n=1 Tax=Bradyrhizobium iriomotense TaxID=441950 RepID=UPI001B8A5A22|nr:hypothetical protein [Bradyrhizobium iriomotense]MBR1129498.1 hypothetical protein [Bradyrhizobium iriomotense]